MIRCNNCGKIFMNEEDITDILEVGKFTKPGGETFRGCPHCMTDMYLMDMEDNENAS